MLPALLALQLLATPAAAGHDVEFWRQIARNNYALPEGESAGALLLELSSLLGSPDPEQRDTLGYEIAARWIYSKELLSPAELRALGALWTANLKAGIGSTGDDSVLLRSFSALNLSVLAAYDNEHPYLSREEFTALLDAALRYLAEEKDVRGYLPGKGWHHSAAHTADLLKFLGRSRHLTPPEQQRILDAIAAKMEAPVFVWGEDERLARAVLSLLVREDLDEAGFEAWRLRVTARSKGLWDGQLDVGRFAAVQNTRNLLRSLFVLLSGEEKPSPARARAKAGILESLGKL